MENSLGKNCYYFGAYLGNLDAVTVNALSCLVQIGIDVPKTTWPAQGVNWPLKTLFWVNKVEGKGSDAQACSHLWNITILPSLVAGYDSLLPKDSSNAPAQPFPLDSLGWPTAPFLDAVNNCQNNIESMATTPPSDWEDLPDQTIVVSTS
jgi:hypothetical protein